MSYPPAPWRLKGPWLAAACTIPVHAARANMPRGARLMRIWPGKTLGGFLAASYEQGSTLTYHELIVFSGLVWRAGRLGVWVSHIYADNPQSVEGGRDMWGVPKELATFTWEPGRVRVEQDGKEIFSLRYSIPPRQLRLPLLVAAFGCVQENLRWFWGRGTGLAGRVQPQVKVVASSPFSSLPLDHYLFAIYGQEVNIWLGGIRALGKMKT